MKNVFLILLLVLLTASFTLAQRGLGQKQLNSNKAWILSQLDLTAEQKDAIESIRLDFKKAEIDILAQQKKNRLEQRQVMKSDDFNKEKYLDHIQKGNELHAELKLMRANMMIDIREQLTADQVKKWQEHAEKNRFAMDKKERFEKRRKMRTKDRNNKIW
jgi:Spy/CpxP family protein refolding chaperone